MSIIAFINSSTPQIDIIKNSLIVPWYNFSNVKSIDLSEVGRIGFIWENNNQMFPFGSTGYLLPNGKFSCFFSQELIDFFKTITIPTEIDLITCELSSQNFKDELELILQEIPQIKFNYSLNLTGNPPYGDWILESSGINIKSIYFNSYIDNFTSVLSASTVFPSGMLLWFDAKDPYNDGTIPADNSVISGWNDKSGGGRDAIASLQNTQTDGIKYSQAGLGGYPTLIFNSSIPGWLKGSVSITGNQVSVLAVVSFSSTTSEWTRIIGFGNSPTSPDYNSNNYFGFVRNQTTNQFGSYRNGVKTFNQASYDTPYLFETWFDGTNLNNTIQIGNSTEITTTSSSGNFGITNFTIGSGNNSDTSYTGTSYLTGSISEIFVFNRALTLIERKFMEGYMSHKWGLVTKLPDSHLYKSFAPQTSYYDLSGCDLSGLDLSSLDLSGYNLTNCNLTNCNLYNVKTGPLVNFPTYLPSDDYKKIISNNQKYIFGPAVNLSNLSFASTDISNIYLPGVNFTNSDLSGTNLSSSIFSNLEGLKFQIYSGYMADDPTFTSRFTKTDTPGYSSDFTSITSATNNIIPANDSRNNYSIEWFGYFRPNVSGTWKFKIGSDDCSYLWLGTNALAGNDTSRNALASSPGLHSFTTSANQSVDLSANIFYPIRIQFGDDTNNDNLVVTVTNPSNTTMTNLSGLVFASNYTNANFTNANLTSSYLALCDLSGCELTNTKTVNVIGKPTLNPIYKNIGKPQISAIQGRTGTLIDRIILYFSDNTTVEYGGSGGSSTTKYNLGENEYVYKIDHYGTGNQLQGLYIKFYTNKQSIVIQGTDYSNQAVTTYIVPDKSILTGINWSGSTISSLITSFQTNNIIGSNLNLENIDLSGYDISNTNLTGSNLSKGNLSYSNLSNNILSNCDLSGTKFLNTIFTNSKCINTNFSFTDLSGCDLSGTDLSGANLFYTKTWPINNLSKISKLPNSNYKTLGKIILGPYLNLQLIDLSGSDISNTKFIKSNLLQSNLSNCDLSGCDLSSCDLSGSNIYNTRTGPFSGVPTVPSIEYRIIKNLDQFNYIIGPQLNLSNMNFSGCDLSGANLSNSNLTNTNFSFADLSGVDLSGVNLLGTNLSNIYNQPINIDSNWLFDPVTKSIIPVITTSNTITNILYNQIQNSQTDTIVVYKNSDTVINQTAKLIKPQTNGSIYWSTPSNDIQIKINDVSMSDVSNIIINVIKQSDISYLLPTINGSQTLFLLYFKALDSYANSVVTPLKPIIMDISLNTNTNFVLLYKYTNSSFDPTNYIIGTKLTSELVTNLYRFIFTSNSNYGATTTNSINMLTGGDPHIRPLLGPQYILPNEIKFVCLLYDIYDGIKINARVGMMKKSDFTNPIFARDSWCNSKKLNYLYNYSYYRELYISIGDESIYINADTLEIKTNGSSLIKYKEIKPVEGIFSLIHKTRYPLFNTTRILKIFVGKYIITLHCDLTTDERHFINLEYFGSNNITACCGAFISRTKIFVMDNIEGEGMDYYDKNFKAYIESLKQNIQI